MPASNPAVVLLPQGSRTGQWRYAKRAHADLSGRFSMKGIIPGTIDFSPSRQSSIASSPILIFSRALKIAASQSMFAKATLNLRLDAIPAEESTP